MYQIAKSVSIAILMTNVSFAQNERTDNEKNAADFDINGNGIVDSTEARSALAYRISKSPEGIDGDRNGMVTPTEALAYAERLENPGKIKLSDYFGLIDPETGAELNYDNNQLTVDEFNSLYFPSAQDKGKRGANFDVQAPFGIIDVEEGRAGWLYRLAQQGRTSLPSYEEINNEAPKGGVAKSLAGHLLDWHSPTVEQFDQDAAFEIEMEPDPFDEFLPKETPLSELLGIKEGNARLILRRESFENALAVASELIAGEGDFSFKKANPALFTYTRDRLRNDNFFSAQGALAYPMMATDSGLIDWENLRGFVVMPSVDFHRDPSQGVDSLIPRLTAEFDLEDVFIEKQYVRVAYAYTTDFSFEAAGRAFELEWEPVILELAIGVNQTIIPELLEYNFRPIIHFEDVHEDATRIGTILRWKFYPIPRYVGPIATYRMDFAVNYDYRNEISGEQDGELFTALMNYQIDDAGHFSLTVSYENGDTPIVRQQIDQFKVAVGVAF